MSTPAVRMRRYQEDLGLAILCVALFLAARAFADHVFPAAVLLFGLAPVPLSLVFLRSGNGSGLMAAAGALATIVAVCPASKVAAALGTFLPLMVCGTLYGMMVNARAGLVRTLVIGTTLLAGLVMSLVYGSGVADLAQSLSIADDGPSAVRDAARARIAPLVQALVPQQSGDSTAQVAHQREQFEAAFSFWFRFPLFFAAATALMIFGAYLCLAQRVLARVGVVTPPARFTEWQVPWEYSWWLIGAIAAFLLTLAGGSEWAQCVVSNVALLVALPYAVTTFSITGYLLESRQVGPVFRTFVYLVVLLNLPYLTLFAMLDPWVDYRKLAVSEVPEGSQDDEEE